MMPILLPFACHGSTIHLVLLRIEERAALPVLAGAVAGKVAGMARQSAATAPGMEPRKHLDSRSLCARIAAERHGPAPPEPATARTICTSWRRQNPRPSRLAISPLTFRSRPRRPPVRPTRSESTPSLEFDRFARFAMTPLPKFNGDNHLCIQR